MALQKQVFSNFTSYKWNALLAKIKADTGTEITTNNGTVTHGSFVFTYVYDAVAQTLTVQCLKKPLFIPAATITTGIAEEIADLVPLVVPTPEQQTPVSVMPLPPQTAPAPVPIAV